MEQTNVEQALSLIFKDGSLLRDNNNFVGFLEHKYVFDYIRRIAIGVGKTTIVRTPQPLMGAPGFFRGGSHRPA